MVWYRKDLHDKLGLTVPTTWDEMMANAAKAKAVGIAPFMLSNQKKWPAQFMWSAMMVNKYGLDAYQGLIDNKIPWTDPRAVDIGRAGLLEGGQRRGQRQRQAELDDPHGRPLPQP